MTGSDEVKTEAARLSEEANSLIKILREIPIWGAEDFFKMLLLKKREAEDKNVEILNQNEQILSSIRTADFSRKHEAVNLEEQARACLLFLDRLKKFNDDVANEVKREGEEIKKEKDTFFIDRDALLIKLSNYISHSVSPRDLTKIKWMVDAMNSLGTHSSSLISWHSVLCEKMQNDFLRDLIRQCNEYARYLGEVIKKQVEFTDPADPIKMANEVLRIFDENKTSAVARKAQEHPNSFGGVLEQYRILKKTLEILQVGNEADLQTVLRDARRVLTENQAILKKNLTGPFLRFWSWLARKISGGDLGSSEGRKFLSFVEMNIFKKMPELNVKEKSRPRAKAIIDEKEKPAIEMTSINPKNINHKK